MTFAPSRFRGYANNYLERHSKKLNPNHRDAFHEGHPDGGYTDPAIDHSLVDRIRSGHPSWDRFEGLYRKLCAHLDINPIAYAEGNERTYWDLDYDLGFVDLDRSYAEGRRFRAVVMRTERSAAARAACIAVHGGDASCVVCGFNFAGVLRRPRQGLHVS